MKLLITIRPWHLVVLIAAIATFSFLFATWTLTELQRARALWWQFQNRRAVLREAKKIMRIARRASAAMTREAARQRRGR
jgi:hypothetical protein